MPNLKGPIPIHALRDLLGVVRVMYADWLASGAGPIELEELRSVGESLNLALGLATRTEPNTMGHRNAWARAEDATLRLGALVGRHSSLVSAVRTASARVVGAPPAPPKFDPNAKVRERYRRG